MDFLQGGIRLYISCCCGVIQTQNRFSHTADVDVQGRKIIGIDQVPQIYRLKQARHGKVLEIQMQSNEGTYRLEVPSLVTIEKHRKSIW